MDRTPLPRRCLPFLLLVLVTLVPAACAGGGGGASAPTPPPFDPSGEWRGTTSVQGASVPFTMVIRGAPGAYTASLNAGGDIPPIAFSSTRVEGNVVTMTGDVMGQGLTIVVTVEGDDLSGSWNAGGDSGPISGSRVAR